MSTQQKEPIKPELIQRFDELCNQSTFFAGRTQNIPESEKQAILSLRTESPDNLPDDSPNWLPTFPEGVSLEQAMSLLRKEKLRGIPYFLWWELGIHGDIEDSARHLAIWASGLIQSSLDVAKQLLAPRFGTIEDNHGQFIVVGLGKLGGWELNLGSDVDLLFVWDAKDDVCSEGGRNTVPAKEYYQHLSKMLIRLMGEQTYEGMTWLTDMRLRPNGDGAPICLSLRATLNHYQDYGQTWERAMLSKASVVAGDATLGKAFLKGIRPFIWRHYMDYTTVQALSEMKQRIDKQSGERILDTGFDVKRGHGGIREIEFMIQSMQLLHGGRDPALAVTPSMQALEKLKLAGHIEANMADTMRQAYRFWRSVEHAVQAQKGLHTHKLPEDWRTWLRFALSDADFEATMKEHSTAVHQLFQKHFKNISEQSVKEDSWIHAGPQQLAKIIDGLFSYEPDEIREKMSETLLTIQNQLQRNLLPERSFAQVETLTTFMLKHWQHDANAATALQAWNDLIHQIGGRATWVDLLANNEQVLLWLANMLASSGYIAKNIARNPTWLEWPLNPHAKEERIAHICRKIAALVPEKNEDDVFLANLGRLVDEARLTTAVCIASDDQLDAMTAGRWLSDVADQTVLATIKLALFQYELPADFPLVALAMGKHGSQSMGLVSDLDMVFLLVHEDPFTLGPKDKNLREWSQRVGRRVIQHLSLKPPFGAGFDFDARLRPSGQSGVLVTTLQAFEHYQLNEAQTWEHQALCRGRPISFDEDINQQVKAVKDKILNLPRDENTLKQDVKSMRLKMVEHLASTSKSQINLKHDEGGLVDIEFLAQYAHLYFDMDDTSTVGALQHLPPEAKAWQKHAPFLIESFMTYRQMENALRVHLWASVGRLPADDGASEWETLRRHTPIQTVADLKAQMLKVHQIFEELLREE